jgi:hypothetical protein
MPICWDTNDGDTITSSFTKRLFANLPVADAGPEPDLANLLKDGVWTMSQKFDHSIVTFGLMELIMMISRKFGSLTFIRNLEADLLRLSCVKKCLPSSSPSATQLLSSPV